MSGRELFARYAYPPNELGYCGPEDTPIGELASHAREFDGAWPYLRAIADAAGIADPLDGDVVRNYWVGGPLLGKVDPDELTTRLRDAFTGQATGMLGAVGGENVLAHHSFHVFVVYPWVLFLDRDPSTPLKVLQDCRIRWGAVQTVEEDHVVIRSAPLTFEHRVLALGGAVTERVRWRKNGESLSPAPTPGSIVAAHWDWVCGTISDADCDALADATARTLELVNQTRTAKNRS